MTKILIEIDTDTQRVVQIATQEERSYPEDERHENGNYFNTCYHCGRTFVGHKRRAVCKVCAVAPQPEPIDVDLRRDAELWRAHQKRKQLTVVKDCDDRYFAYDLSSEKIGPQVCIAEIVTIDAAMSQGEQK